MELTKCKNPRCRGPVEQTGTGRPAIYCSDACKQMHYRERKAANDRAAAIAAAIRAEQERLAWLESIVIDVLHDNGVARAKQPLIAAQLVNRLVLDLGQGTLL